MGFNGIDAILNCLEEDIGYYEDKVSKPMPREITDSIANWYLKVRELCKKQPRPTEEIIRMFSMQGDDNGNFFMYSLSDTMAQNMLTKSEQSRMASEDNFRTLRIEMLKSSIREALNSFLNGIEVVPFSICKINEPSPNKYKASGTKGEQIEIRKPHDHNHTINISTNGKHITIDIINYICHVRSDGKVTLLQHEEEKKQAGNKKKFLFGFRKKDTNFELELAKREEVTIYQDVVTPGHRACGTIYEDNGVYIFMAKDAKFEISYFNEQTLSLLSSGINKEGVDGNMKHYIELITKKERLTYEYFLELLKQYGIFPDYTISTPCTHQEVPSLANAAYHNPRALMEELQKRKNQTK